MRTLRELLGRGGFLAPGPHRASRIRETEGPRGYSTRASVFARYAVYFATVVLCSAVSHACFAHADRWRAGGEWMFFSAMLMFVTGAAGTMFYTNQRNEIIEQVRHYVFGLSVFPGTAIAIVMWASQGLTSSPTSSSDAFTALLGNAIPVVYFCTVILPPLVFVKAMAGIRTLHRSRLDDEEMVAVWTRQDGQQH